MGTGYGRQNSLLLARHAVLVTQSFLLERLRDRDCVTSQKNVCERRLQAEWRGKSIFYSHKPRPLPSRVKYELPQQKTFATQMAMMLVVIFKMTSSNYLLPAMIVQIKKINSLQNSKELSKITSSIIKGELVESFHLNGH